MVNIHNTGTLGHYGGYGGTTSPTVPEASPIQTTLPTSAYGQTIPVVYGKCRLPGAYIWVPPIVTVTSTHMEWWDQITTTTSKMSCRLRFARPLVANSTWALRKIYCNGTLIYDASQGYRAKGLKFRAYDGRSTQDRDPTMTKEEGTTNVSAHRGYLDIVLTDFDIQSFGSPPTFEAEWIQDGAATHDYDTFSTFDGGGLLFDPEWTSGVLYARGPSFLKRYSIWTTGEFYSVDNPIVANYFLGLRYSPRLDRIVYLAGFSAPGAAYLIDPTSGAVLAQAADVAALGLVQNTVAFSDINNGAILVGFADNEQIFSFYFAESSAVRAYQSSASWGGYSSIQCVTPGEVRGSELDFYFCADADLVKVTLTATGALKSSVVLATLADDLRYAVYDDDGDLIVWTDAATVSRVDGTTGTVEYTKTVPYQIPAVASRNMGDPDQHRLTEELYFTSGGVSYFTDLKTGVTRSLSGAVASPHTFFYDGQTDTVITRDNAAVPQRLRFIAGNGELRQLSDFLEKLMIAGGFESSQVQTINIDDVIEGAVIDLTAGTRDIARAIIEPYSIAMFERSGQIIFKRASTDGTFAVDQSIAAAGDIVDQ
ncbi:hypothetical protein [Mesorhizobium sp. WSM3873]|uniref:hypothetical protein n=1 Tax=Mesorhizobium sp. WSM3873 TaxID=1854056 RepID=UPI000A725D43|nr:hypothetical protein [Mesorhizobium sp. WSM3873]